MPFSDAFRIKQSESEDLAGIKLSKHATSDDVLQHMRLVTQKKTNAFGIRLIVSGIQSRVSSPNMFGFRLIPGDG